MRILFIDVNCKQNSTGKIVYDLYNGCNSKGNSAAICYGRGAIVDEPNILKFSSNIEIYFHAFLTRITGFTGCYSYFATRKLLKFIKLFNPDVVHIHELHAYFINIKPLINYLKKNNIKTVWTFHCEFMYTGKCGHAYECKKWKCGCGKCPDINRYPSSLLFDFTKKMHNDKKRLFKDFDNLTIITPSQWLADRVNQSFLKNKKTKVIHNGMDTVNVFKPRACEYLKAKHSITNEKIVLAVAPGLLSEEKGGRYILKIAERMKNENLKFILIGVDEKDKNFGSNVITLGRTEDQIQLAQYYSLADITVLPSKKETFSLVCAESLACGTPVVGFDSGAPKEIAPQGFGVFVPYGNIDALEEAIRLSLSNPKIFKESKECVQFSREHYDKTIMTNNYLNLYKDLL
ncbi:MAG: glycosyltransferase [Clostridiaceae bacterium]